MTVELPREPRQASITFTPVDYGGMLTPSTGGPSQRLNRNGNRWSVSVQLPPMRVESLARLWIVALTRGLRDSVRFYILQPDFAVGPVGQPKVNGAGQAGVALVVDGGTARYTYRPSQWVTVETGGVGHLYMVTDSKMADGAGAAVLPIEPPLRVEPADNDLVHVTAPFIDGTLGQGGVPWTIDVARTIGLSFTVTEME